MLSCQGHLLPLWKLVVSSRQQALGSPLVEINVNFEALAWCVRSKQRCTQELRSRFPSTAWDAFWLQHKAWANPSGGKKKYIYIYTNILYAIFCTLGTVGRHRLGPEHVQISTPETWPHPNTMRASGARALGGMFGNARATHTAKLCPKNIEQKTQKCWDKKSCAGSAGAKKVYAGHARSHIGTLLPRDVSLHDCRHIEIDA